MIGKYGPKSSSSDQGSTTEGQEAELVQTISHRAEGLGMLHEEAHQEMSLEGDLAGEGADWPAATSGKSMGSEEWGTRRRSPTTFRRLTGAFTNSLVMSKCFTVNTLG